MKASWWFMLCMPLMVQAQQKKVDEAFKLKWEQKIGLTNFRTNIIYDQGAIYVGSNGGAAHAQTDSLDGIHKVDAKTGDHILTYRSAREGEDFNGISITSNQLFAAADNGKLYCWHTDSAGGGWHWALLPLFPALEQGPDAVETVLHVDPDIEGVPVLADFNRDNQDDVLLATETGDVALLDGRDGRLIWQWSATSTTVQRYFIGSPAILDINGDSIPEIFIGARKREKWVASTGGEFYCLDGKTGKPLWSNDCGSGISSSPHIYITPKDTNIIVSAAYGDIFLFGPNGRHRVTHLKNPSGGIEGLFGSPIITEGKIIQGTSWWGFSPYTKDNVWMVSADSSQYLPTGRVSATATVGNVLKKGTQAVIPTEKGELLVLDYSKRRVFRYWLDEPITPEQFDDRMFRNGAEASVLLADVDDDGKTEMVIAHLDGYLRCYETKGKWVPTGMSQFRFDNKGTGVIRVESLGF